MIAAIGYVSKFGLSPSRNEPSSVVRASTAARRAQLERPDRMVDDVAAHVAHRAGAEIPPAAPIHRGISRMIGPLADRAEPEVPVERRRDRRRVRGPADPLLPQAGRRDRTRRELRAPRR